MFKKGPDIDKKKLLAKASDVKKDSLARLKHFKTLIEHLDSNELPLLFKSHFSFIYHTFIDTFSTFDCNSKQRREDLDCILFMLEEILIYNAELIKKRWQFYSITFVMQKLLHQSNTWKLRQQGVRLFILWYLILCDETNPELQTMFGSIVPDIVPQSSYPTPSSTPLQYHSQQPPPLPSQSQQLYQQHSVPSLGSPHSATKLCTIDPLVPISANEQLPTNPISFYLDNLLQYMVTQITKPHWGTFEEARKNQELSFSFLFTMFKRVYLQHLFPNFNSDIFESGAGKSNRVNHSIDQYVDDVGDVVSRSAMIGQYNDVKTQATHPPNPRRDLHIDLKQSSHLVPSGMVSQASNDYERSINLSVYQSIVIRWLTRIMRQDLIPGQDELVKTGGSVERRDLQAGNKDFAQGQDQSYSNEGNTSTIFQNIETSSREMEVARKVVGTWPENIAIMHEIFRRAFLNFFQPASMKRVVNVYKEWICNGNSNQAGAAQHKNVRLGYTSFAELLQVFVLNSSNAFITKVHNPAMLDEQVEMCKRIMNIYRYMVMKIYMNNTTWDQFLNSMLMITKNLFPPNPPEKKETTIGGRIAPAFFQTFIVSWIRANLYVHVSNQMWDEFHHVMKSLIEWREIIEEWGTTMSSLTRVLVKHVYGLNLADLPLERPQERRRRPRAMKSLSTADTERLSGNKSSSGHVARDYVDSSKNVPILEDAGTRNKSNRAVTSGSNKTGLPVLIRSNSDSLLLESCAEKFYRASQRSDPTVVNRRMRKIKSEYTLFDTNLHLSIGCRSSSPTHNDVIDGASLKDPNMIIDNDQDFESQGPIKFPQEEPRGNKKMENKSSNADKCALLGGTVRGWTQENSVIMWRRMLGLFGNINSIADPESHLVAMRCLSEMLSDFIKARDNLAISIDNQSTPEHPSLIPPYTYSVGWLLEATHLPRQFDGSRILAYKLLCTMSIRRHDIELPPQYFAAFYESLHRGLTSQDTAIYSSIIRSAVQLLSLELPGCTFLVQDLFERSRSILATSTQQTSSISQSSPKSEAIRILHSILALYKPIKKLLVLKPDVSNTMSLVTSDDMRSKISETLLSCNSRPHVLDSQTRCKSIWAMAIHVFQELTDKNDGIDVERLFDTIIIDMQESNSDDMFRINCDLLRLFAEYSTSLCQSRPLIVSSVIQVLCQLIVRLSVGENNLESILCLLICLEEWCIAVGKSFLLKSLDEFGYEDGDNFPSRASESLLTVVLRSLESVSYEESHLEESTHSGSRSVGTPKSSDTISNHQFQMGSSTDQFSGSRDRTMTNEDYRRVQQDIPHKNDHRNTTALKLACKVARDKLITYLGNFPLKQVGAASLGCNVIESDYLNSGSSGDIADFKNATDICILVLDGSTIISFIGSARHLKQAAPLHMIVRNICGKFSWDAHCIDFEMDQSSKQSSSEESSIVVDPELFLQEDPRSPMKFDPDYNEDGNSSSSLSSRSSANRDQIGDLLNQLSSPFLNGSNTSSYQSSYKKRSSALSVSNPTFKVAQAEETMIALLTNQRFQELNYCESSVDLDRVVIDFGDKLNFRDMESNIHFDKYDPASPLSFDQCRQLIQQLGYLTWEKRSKVDSLAKSNRLLRELKNLDAQPGRETHKIAVFYVANGQEDKNSILSNSSGSRSFEDFVSSLGWEVSLANHLGFRGGLQSNNSTGETSPYYCTSTTEVMFHVSTRIPIHGTQDDESLNKKLRHLGNDEVHIVWSEHSRDYRRGIIPTEFGDVIIAIYPMLTFHGYFRISITSRPEVPPFGPLFDNCIVHQTSLASLVRATAINASRAKRIKLPYYQSHFEERSRLIESIIQNHREKLSFEDFALQFYQLSSFTRDDQHLAKQDASCCA